MDMLVQCCCVVLQGIPCEAREVPNEKIWRTVVLSLICLSHKSCLQGSGQCLFVFIFIQPINHCSNCSINIHASRITCTSCLCLLHCVLGRRSPIPTRLHTEAAQELRDRGHSRQGFQETFQASHDAAELNTQQIPISRRADVCFQLSLQCEFENVRNFLPRLGSGQRSQGFWI